MLARILLCALVAPLYLLTLCPGPFWLDSSEFIAGAHTMGVVHPPGHPLYIFLAKAISVLMPFGDIAFRINVLSALLGTMCAWLVAFIVENLLVWANRTTPFASWSGASAGLLFAVTPAAWMESTRAEVYTLNAAMVLGCITLALKWWRTRNDKLVYSFAVLSGLALCNHHYLVVFFLPAALALLCMAPKPNSLLLSRRATNSVILGAMALVTYLYVPLRAATNPIINWGHATNWQRFYEVITAKTFQASVDATQRSTSIAENAATALGMFSEQITAVGLLAGLLGLLAITVGQRALGGFLWLCLVLNILTKGLMFIDPDNPDDYGYFLLSIATLCIGVGCAASTIQNLWAHRTWPVATMIFATTIGYTHFPKADLSQDYSASVIASSTLDRVEPGAIVLANYYSHLFNLWHAQLVYGERPDVALVQSTFDSKRHNGVPYVESLLKRHPELAPVTDSFVETGNFPVAQLIQLSRKQPVYLEPFPENAFPAKAHSATGMVRKISPQKTDAPDAQSKDNQHWATINDALNLGTLNREALKILQYTQFIHAVLALRQERIQIAKQAIKRGREYGSKSIHFKHLEAEIKSSKQTNSTEKLRNLEASALLNPQ